MSNIWFVSDTHFDHGRILEYDKRPFSTIEEHNEKLIENWNKEVKDDDEVYHLGDFAWRSAIPYIQRLNGKIHLIKGNHDEHTEGAWSLQGRTDLFSNFVSFNDAVFLKIKGFPAIYMLHYACRVWRDSHKGSIHLYGHSHHGLESNPWGKSMDVGINGIGYKPISIEEVKLRMDKRPIGEHH